LHGKALEQSMTEYKFHSQPPSVGYWLMPGSAPAHEVRFMMTKKPNWVHRTFMRLLLGWEWKDEA
jgi:hypothetical protein